MQMELRWIASFSASCVHATSAIWRGFPCSDSALVTALAAPIERFLNAVTASRMPVDVFLRHLLPLSAEQHSNRELMVIALRKTLGGGDHDGRVARLSTALADIQRVFQQQHPRVVEQLELRAPVLREQWEARGPGLLTCIGHMADESLLAERADVVLVHPILGGGGTAHLLYNQVTVEAVLANPHADLPEVIRLAWMLAQLNMEIPKISESVSGICLPRVTALSMVPVTLAAAEQVELTLLNKAAVGRAIDVWLPAEPDSAAAAETIWQWWEVYQNARPQWPVALAALDRMLNDND